MGVGDVLKNDRTEKLLLSSIYFSSLTKGMHVVSPSAMLGLRSDVQTRTK